MLNHPWTRFSLSMQSWSSRDSMTSQYKDRLGPKEHSMTQQDCDWCGLHTVQHDRNIAIYGLRWLWLLLLDVHRSDGYRQILSTEQSSVYRGDSGEMGSGWCSTCSYHWGAALPCHPMPILIYNTIGAWTRVYLCVCLSSYRHVWLNMYKQCWIPLILFDYCFWPDARILDTC